MLTKNVTHKLVIMYLKNKNIFIWLLFSLQLCDLENLHISV